MTPNDDFASLFNTTGQAGGSVKRLRKGELVEGVVVQIASDCVYVDVGTPSEARVDKSSLLDEKGELRVKVGDPIQATVVDARPNSLRLSVGFGKGSALDTSSLRLAMETRTSVTGKVVKAQKGGLEIDLAGIRGFCPASQIELSYVQDLSVYEGQDLEFLVAELREGGRDVVLSRRQLLDMRRQQAFADARAKLSQGAEVDGVVKSVSRHGVVVDVGGIDGFVHISEMAHHRVERPEALAPIGTPVRVLVLGFETTDRGERLRLSIRQTADANAAAEAVAAQKVDPVKDEILEGTVAKAIPGGLIVRTAKGEGFVPQRELELAPGADHRRAYPVGSTLKVVVVSKDVARGRFTFSVRNVAHVEERKNYETFSGQGKASSSSAFGSFGELLKSHLDKSVAARPAQPAAGNKPKGR
ncbi:MAG: S1 RNA-binding domain-containing protein [Myxococcales bacterium]